jgi:hypothetical protein
MEAFALAAYASKFSSSPLDNTAVIETVVFSILFFQQALSFTDFGLPVDSDKISSMIYNPSQDTFALLSKTAIFRNLDPVQLQEIVSSAHRFEVERRCFLFHQGEPADFFYVLLEGNARLSQITPEGRQVINLNSELN